jgi:glutamate dehydrogenase (NAD(P)+)
MESYNSFEVAQTHIRSVARMLNLDQATLDLLLWPQREFKFTLPVKMDSGETSITSGLTATFPHRMSTRIRRRWRG